MRYYLNLFYSCFLPVLIVNSTSNAQGKIIDFSRSQSVDVVTKEMIYNVKIANVSDILRFSPQTHHLNSRTITYDLRGGRIDKNIQNIFYDGNNEPAYLQSVYNDANGITLKAIEEVHIGTDLKQGYRWNNIEQQSAQIYDDAADRYNNFTFTPEWKPMFTYTPFDLSTVRPMDKTRWHQEVRSVFDKTVSIEAATDNMYGGRGDITYTSQRDMKIKETKLYDRDGNLREYIYQEYYPDDWVYEEITYYDCHGRKVYFESTLFDDYDYEIEMVDIAYKNGKPVAGWRDVDDDDISFRQYYNPDTGMFEYINIFNWDYAEYKWSSGMAKADQPCGQYKFNEIFGGVSFISEDSYERFTTIGLNVNYTRYICPDFGITGDAGITFGSQFNTDYSKINIFAGITYFPFKTMQREAQWSIALRALAGVTSVTGKTSQYKNTSSDLGGFLGVNIDYDLSKNLGMQGNAGWNPVFGNGNTSSNYRFGAGLRYSF